MAVRNEDGFVLRLSRRFDAPRERVLDGWTDPELLQGWWAEHKAKRASDSH
jgi:uncharacterized protein YndB with AHSA1/START domain